MSRILRRPMFRGGRVDSRGTGITSGLSYKHGGSVNTPKRGLVDGPGGYSGLTDPQAVIDARKLGILMTPDWLNKKFRKKYYLDDEVEYVPDPASLGMQGMVSDTYGLGIGGNPVIDAGGTIDTVRDLIFTGDKRGTPAEYEEFFKEKFIKDNYATELEKQKQILAAAGDKRLSQLTDDTKVPEEGESRAEFEERIKREAAEELQALIKRQTDKDPAAEIEKNKKIFQKAYGSGIADDASNMLLSFAGKALKEGATTKSAFGEFFEEEGKRPSERKKYKDAATTAAINAYLTGQKSMADLDRALKINRATMQDKIAFGNLASSLKGKDWNTALDIVQRDRYKGAKKRDSFTVVSETLKGLFEKPVDQKKGNLKDIDAEDLIEGFTILTTDSGKIIIEKIDGVVKERTDLLI